MPVSRSCNSHPWLVATRCLYTRATADIAANGCSSSALVHALRQQVARMQEAAARSCQTARQLATAATHLGGSCAKISSSASAAAALPNDCHCSSVNPCVHMPAIPAAPYSSSRLHCASAAWQYISPEKSCGCRPAWKLTWHTRASPGSSTPAKQQHTNRALLTSHLLRSPRASRLKIAFVGQASSGQGGSAAVARQKAAAGKASTTCL